MFSSVCLCPAAKSALSLANKRFGREEWGFVRDSEGAGRHGWGFVLVRGQGYREWSGVMKEGEEMDENREFMY